MDNDNIARYVINFDELEGLLKHIVLKDISDAILEKYPQLDTKNIEDMLSDLEDLLPSVKYKELQNRIYNLINYKQEGTQKIKGGTLDIPAIEGDYPIDFAFDNDIFITGIHFNQTGWKKEDKYSLEINKIKIINGAYTKEIGEHKHFNTYYKVNANTLISFILHNISGNSRQVTADLEYIEATTSTKIGNIGINDIKNDWDIAVVMNWETGAVDLDLHGFIGDKHVWYSNKDMEGFHLNFDFTEHETNMNPEILSVKGYKDSKLDIFIHDFNGKILNNPANIKIYSKKPYGNILLKEININIVNDKSYLQGICTIDLGTLEVTTLNKKINTINGGV